MEWRWGKAAFKRRMTTMTHRGVAYLQVNDEQRRQPGPRRHKVRGHDGQLHILTDVVDLARDAEHVRPQQHANGVSGRLLHAVAQVVARSHLEKQSPLWVPLPYLFLNPSPPDIDGTSKFHRLPRCKASTWNVPGGQCAQNPLG
jgi:hypothetical protein